MKEIKRCNPVYVGDSHDARVHMESHSKGEWVRYEDIVPNRTCEECGKTDLVSVVTMKDGSRLCPSCCIYKSEYTDSYEKTRQEDSAPPPVPGWVCPVCGCGNSPWNLTCMRCISKNTWLG